VRDISDLVCVGEERKKNEILTAISHRQSLALVYLLCRNTQYRVITLK
jgi:hypothetical protein